MNQQTKLAEPCATQLGHADAPKGGRKLLFTAWVIIAVDIYGKWLVRWAQFAWNDGLASYTLLIPIISGYLIWQNRREPIQRAKTSAIAGVIALTAAMFFTVLAWRNSAENALNDVTRFDFLSAAILGFICFVVAGGLLLLGGPVLRPHSFALGFLLFSVPLPSWGVHGLEMFFQHTSAEVAAVMIDIARIPNLRDGLIFKLPGITIQVAQECSGIRSSVVLFITSILAGHLFLKSRWKRTILGLMVIPLGILRNGFRIVTIAALCTHVGPEMIDSPIHHRGGPLFFGLSLIPLFAFLLWLRWLEQRTKAANPPLSSVPQRRTSSQN
jgi:exosortase C (VPDSG-CTERM-specific)